VNGYTFADLESDLFIAPSAAKSLFLQILGRYVDKYNPKDKMLLLGYNINFDADFIREWFLKMGDKYFGSWFWFPPICTMQKAADVIGEDRPKLENFKLATVAKYFGVEFDETQLHDALADIDLTVKLHRKLNN